MNFYVDSGGEIISVDAERIFQGSANANTIRFIGAFPANASVAVSYRLPLPSGIVTERQLLAFNKGLSGIQNESGVTFNVWEIGLGVKYVNGKYLPDYTVLENAGVVNVQFFITLSNENGEVVKQATARSSFVVEQGNTPDIPPAPYDDYEGLLNQILAAVSARGNNKVNKSGDTMTGNLNVVGTVETENGNEERLITLSSETGEVEVYGEVEPYGNNTPEANAHDIHSTHYGSRKIAHKVDVYFNSKYDHSYEYTFLFPEKDGTLVLDKDIKELANGITLSINPKTFILTARLYHDGNSISSSEVDLPLESMVVDGSFNEEEKQIVLTLQNGNEVKIPVGDLVDGLISESAFNETIQRIESTLSNFIESKGQPNGFAGLDANGKVPKEQLPAGSGGDGISAEEFEELLVESLTNPTETWTDEEKAAACKTIGAVKQSEVSAIGNNKVNKSGDTMTGSLIVGYIGEGENEDKTRAARMSSESGVFEVLDGKNKTEYNHGYIRELYGEKERSFLFPSSSGILARLEDINKAKEQLQDEMTELRAEIVQDVIADAENFIVTELAKRGQLKPEFSQSEEWLDANGDTSKLYVLPDGMIWANILTETEGETKPNFKNVMDEDDAYFLNGKRAKSSGIFVDVPTDCAIVIPITGGATQTIRVRGAGNEAAYKDTAYWGTNNQSLTLQGTGATRTVEENGDIKIVTKHPSTASYMVFHVQAGVEADTLIVTIDQEITYTTEEDKIEYKWKNTGHAFVPADYEPRIIANETNIKTLQAETKNLTNRLDNMSINAGGGTENIVFSLPAFAPVPQKAPTADGGGIMDVRAIRTNTYYEYMDRLVAKHPNYLYKQYMGQDATNTYAHYRYIACRSYYHAWVLDNYPKMYAWKNGNTVVYSVSVSPRVDDVMYSTPYVGISYGKVSVVNCVFETTTDAYGYQEQRKESTRTVNGLEFERYTTADVEPTIVFTTAKHEYADCIVYNTSFSNETTVTKIENDVMSCANGKKYTRYPFEDRRSDQSRPLSIFILSNEHAGCNWGDSSIVSIIVAQFLTDMCENKNIPLLRWIKDNCMITTIPIGNPWGYSEDSIDGYNNGNGVNINRNYDTPGWCLGEYDLGGSHGDYAGSESETQHIMNTIHLCNADIGLSMHGVGHHNETPTQGGYAQMQGQAFDFSIRRGLEEILTTSYNLGLEADINIKNDPYHTGKSATYIQWAGAIGGITETVPWNVLTGEYFDSVAMEAGYTQLLLFLQCLIKEALEKLG